MSEVNDLFESNDGPHLDSVIGFLQGQKTERERWEAWLARIRTWTEGKSADYQEGALFQQQRIIKLLRARVTKHHPTLTIDIDDLEALIKGEQNV